MAIPWGPILGAVGLLGAAVIQRRSSKDVAQAYNRQAEQARQLQEQRKRQFEEAKKLAEQQARESAQRETVQASQTAQTANKLISQSMVFAPLAVGAFLLVRGK